MTRPRLILRDRFYVDERHVDSRRLRELFEVASTSKADCRPGCPLAMKRGRYCSTCPSRDARVVLWARIRLASGRVLIALPAGDHSLVRSLVGEFDFVDRRPDPQMRGGLEWRGRLRDGSLDAKGRKTSDQRHMLREWRRHTEHDTGGIVVSPPRSGKCVVGDSLVRTERGYSLIRDLFPEGDCERIGRFGTVAAPDGNREVRGLISRVASRVLRVTTRCGISLTGTPEHPLRSSRLRRVDWRRLDELSPGDFIFMPPEPYAETVGGLTDADAALLGRVMGQADISALERGAVLIDADSADAGYPGVMADLEDRGLGAEALGVDELGLLDWKRRMMASGTSAWRAFASALLSGDPREVITLRVVDELLARALHVHLVGSGVPAHLQRVEVDHSLRAVYSLTVTRQYVDFYLRGERSPLVELGMTSAVTSIEVIDGTTRVYDMMVPEGRAYTANGVACHNTVLGVAASLATKSRTFITASKIDWLRQFGRRYGELTNARELYARGRRPIVLIDPRGWSEGPRYGIHVLKKWGPDVDRADVVMSCYHQLLETDRGRERLRRYADGKFGLFIGDEIHLAGAPCFSRVANRIAVRRRMGLTGTPHRKDGLFPISTAVLGRVCVVGRVASDLPRVELLETGVGSTRSYSNWNAMVKFMVESDVRNRKILQNVFADLRADAKHCILIPVTRRDHIHRLIKMINAQAAYCTSERGESWPTELAVSYYGKSDTNAVLNQVSAGRARVVVAMVSMIQYGLDVARWTHVYVGVIPTSNPYNVYQMLNRVCTPYTKELQDKLGDKPQSVVRYFIDEMSASVFCFARLFGDKDYGIAAGLSGVNYFGVKLCTADSAVALRAAEIAKFPKSYSAKDAGVKVELGVTRTGKRRRKSAWEPTKSVRRF